LDWFYLLHAVNDMPQGVPPEVVEERRELIEKAEEGLDQG
jgi:hypothetical protein